MSPKTHWVHVTDVGGAANNRLSEFLSYLLALTPDKCSGNHAVLFPDIHSSQNQVSKAQGTF